MSRHNPYKMFPRELAKTNTIFKPLPRRLDLCRTRGSYLATVKTWLAGGYYGRNAWYRIQKDQHKRWARHQFRQYIDRQTLLEEYYYES
jgi:hypothetical protein